jgi:hypothetical protein
MHVCSRGSKGDQGSHEEYVGDDNVLRHCITKTTKISRDEVAGYNRCQLSSLHLPYRDQMERRLNDIQKASPAKRKINVQRCVFRKKKATKATLPTRQSITIPRSLPRKRKNRSSIDEPVIFGTACGIKMDRKTQWYASPREPRCPGPYMLDSSILVPHASRKITLITGMEVKMQKNQGGTRTFAKYRYRYLFWCSIRQGVHICAYLDERTQHLHADMSLGGNSLNKRVVERRENAVDDKY